MRYGVLSDVHANLPALRAALRHLAAEQVSYLCLGDLVGYGAHPNECVSTVAALQPLAIAGNHELVALGDLDDRRCGQLAQDSLRWTRQALSDESKRYLRALPRQAGAAEGFMLAHGSPHDPEEYVETADRARQLLAKLPKHARLLLLGHTHHAWAFSAEQGTLLRRRAGTVDLQPGHRYVLNPGSVGQSRDRLVRARFMVLDLDASTASFHAVRYDAASSRRSLVDAGLPAHSLHRPPTVRERAAHVLRRAGLGGR